MAPAGLRRPPALMISGGFPWVGSRGVNRRGVTLSTERCRPGRQEGPQPAVILEPGRWNRPLLRGCWGRAASLWPRPWGSRTSSRKCRGRVATDTPPHLLSHLLLSPSPTSPCPPPPGPLQHLQHLSSAEPSPALRSGRHASHHHLVSVSGSKPRAFLSLESPV